MFGNVIIWKKTFASWNFQSIVWIHTPAELKGIMREKYIISHYLVYISCPETEGAMARKWEKMLGIIVRWIWGGRVIRKDDTWTKGKENNKEALEVRHYYA